MRAHGVANAAVPQAPELHRGALLRAAAKRAVRRAVQPCAARPGLTRDREEPRKCSSRYKRTKAQCTSASGIDPRASLPGRRTHPRSTHVTADVAHLFLPPSRVAPPPLASVHRCAAQAAACGSMPAAKPRAAARTPPPQAATASWGVLRLVLCAAGIYGAYLTQGMVQEELSTQRCVRVAPARASPGRSPPRAAAADPGQRRSSSHTSCS